MNIHAPMPESVHGTEIVNDRLDGADEIAAFLGKCWTADRVYHVRRRRGLPIRKLPGAGIYAFKSELLAALKSQETLS